MRNLNTVHTKMTLTQYWKIILNQKKPVAFFQKACDAYLFGSRSKIATTREESKVKVDKGKKIKRVPWKKRERLICRTVEFGNCQRRDSLRGEGEWRNIGWKSWWQIHQVSVEQGLLKHAHCETPLRFCSGTVSDVGRDYWFWLDNFFKVFKWNPMKNLPFVHSAVNRGKPIEVTSQDDTRNGGRC